MGPRIEQQLFQRRLAQMQPIADHIIRLCVAVSALERFRRVQERESQLLRQFFQRLIEIIQRSENSGA